MIGSCTGLPTTSPVTPGRGVDEKVDDVARIVVPPPAPGATPEQVVRGFIRAGAAFQESSASTEPVGTAYLAPGSSDRWRPTSQVTVYDRATPVSVARVGPDSFRVSTVAVAVIDESGRYRELPRGTIVEATFEVVEVGGESRIVLPGKGFGVWVSTDDFGRIFDPYRVYYPVVGGRRLVPDVRWLPTGPRLVTLLARAQLGPVPDYLRGTVETGFPEGTQLAVDAVSVQSGLATVVLTAPASSADAAHRRAIWAQLTATLLAAAPVSSVSVEVQESGPLPLPEAAGPARSPVDVGYAFGPLPVPRIALQRNGESVQWVDVTQVDDGVLTPAATGPELPTVPAAYTSLAVAPDRSEIAGVPAGGGEAVRWRGRGRIPVQGVGPGLVPPTYDGMGRLWLADVAPGGGRVWTLETSVGQAEPVSVGWLGGRLPVALAVSRDSTRVALVSTDAGGAEPRLDIAGVVRDAGGRPIALAKPYRQAEPLARIIDVTWLDDTTLAALGSLSAGEATRPFVVELGQGIGLRRRGTADPEQQLLPPVSGATGLAGVSSPRGIVVLTALPSVLVRLGSSWRRVGEATGFALVPVTASFASGR